MDISLDWLNSYLDPGDLTADEADHLLTEAGFPIEQVKRAADGSVVLDVEITSNRGDCLSHIGCAREIAASTMASKVRQLVLPETAPTPTGKPAADSISLDNTVPEVCPRFTARLIRGVKIGPSPSWLVARLEAMGQRSINNIVDVTNFITLECGNPCHVFDLAKMAGGKVVVRFANAGETIKTLYAGEHTLRATDLVVADAERPQSLAGVIGGFDSQVDDATTDVIFEMATWDPATIRATGRKFQISTDARFRFERIVDPRTIDEAADRAVALICELSGGELASGVLAEGAPMAEPLVVTLRPSRCDLVLGITTPAGRVIELLRRLDIGVEQLGGDELACTIPPHRPDLTREIDLIEEVVRTRGLGDIPLAETLSVRVQPPQPAERAVQTIGGVLTGLGFFETVTFSFVSPERGLAWVDAGSETVSVDDSRRKAEPTLRPSILPSLLACRKANQDARVDQPGGVRLFETSAVFAQSTGATETFEHRSLAMVCDALGTGPKRSLDDIQRGSRVIRGAIDAVVRECFGPNAKVRVTPAPPTQQGWDPSAHARVSVEVDDHDPITLGSMGLISKAVLSDCDLDIPVIAAELRLDALTDAYPPKVSADRLPEFPGIERDLSLVVPETVLWDRVEQLAVSLGLEHLERVGMVGVYRGKQMAAGTKSVTIRLSFRDPAGTLRREQVEPAVERFEAAAKAELGAEIRG